MQESTSPDKLPHDSVNHPGHYNSNPSGVECITVVEHMSFNIGNAVKYLWRAGEKGDALEDLRKAAWYVNREVERMSKQLSVTLTQAQADELRARWEKGNHK